MILSSFLLSLMFLIILLGTTPKPGLEAVHYVFLGVLGVCVIYSFATKPDNY
jgi:hypothetical protein